MGQAERALAESKRLPDLCPLNGLNLSHMMCLLAECLRPAEPLVECAPILWVIEKG